MLYSATSAEKSISYAVQHQCPQCGAPVTLEEDTRFFVCGFCRVQSFICQKGFPRYYLSPSPKVPEDTDLVYLPYWRFKGVRYTCHATGIKSKFTDISTLARQDLPSRIPLFSRVPVPGFDLETHYQRNQRKFPQAITCGRGPKG